MTMAAQLHSATAIVSSAAQRNVQAVPPTVAFGRPGNVNVDSALRYVFEPDRPTGPALSAVFATIGRRIAGGDSQADDRTTRSNCLDGVDEPLLDLLSADWLRR